MRRPGMPRWLLPLLLTTLVTAYCPPGSAHELDAFVAAQMRLWAIPGLAIAVVQNNQIVFAKGYGVRELGRPEPVDENTTFGIGSVTKSFTAGAAAMLADEGKLAWDAPVIDYVPALHFSDPWITSHATVLDLSAHRLGIEEAAIYNLRGGNLDTTLHAIRYMRPGGPFRSFLYSNAGYALLGKTIQNVSGLTWDDFIAERIFKPLEMTHSHTNEYQFIEADSIARCWLCVPPAGAKAKIGHAALENPNTNAAVPHGLRDSTQPGGTQADTALDMAARVEVLPWNSALPVAPAGLIHSSATDMAHWMMFHLAEGEYGGHELLSAPQIKQLHAPHALLREEDGASVEGFKLTSYGMGWFLGTYYGMEASQHGGGRAGYGSQVWLFPSRKLGVVVLQNLHYREGPPLSLIATRFADHYLGIAHNAAADDEKARTLHARFAKARATAMQAIHALCSRKPDTHSQDRSGQDRAGKYHNDILGDVQLSSDRGHLAIAFDAGSVADLIPAAHDTFTVCSRAREQQPAPLRFTYDREGAATGFVIESQDLEDGSDLIFKRVPRDITRQ